MKLAEKGVPVFGICGGYQMMGEEIADPHGVEAGGSMRGMGLLPVRTIFGRSKVTTQAKGRMEELTGPWAALSGRTYEGYEIHMGDTEVDTDRGDVQILARKEDRILGICRGHAAGTYIHGIFDSREISGAILEKLAAAKGIALEDLGEGMDFKTYKEDQYRLLAEGIRASLDMEAVYRIIGEGL